MEGGDEEIHRGAGAPRSRSGPGTESPETFEVSDDAITGKLAGLFLLPLFRGLRRVLRRLFQTPPRPLRPTKGDKLRALVPQMTEHPGQNEWPVPEHDVENIRWKRLAVIVSVILSVYALGVVIAWLQLRFLQRGRSLEIPWRIGERRINMLIQPLFDLETGAYEQHRRERRRLSSYGWVDEERGLIHIPIERAIDQLVREQKPETPGGEP